MSKYTTPELIAEIRRQAAMRNATWPCVLLKDLLPLCDEVERMNSSRDFYMRRCEALQAVQDKMRDPERKAVCDILANGSTTALQPNALGNAPHEAQDFSDKGGRSR